jgi:DNA invertase Pin-like site-specific DNA recombinase
MNPNACDPLPLGEHKATPRHRDRLAVVYVRQSSVHQVQRHRESTQLQYGLVEHAVRLGWPRERVLVLDEDLGLSGASAQTRSGFQRLLSEVALGHVGLILGVEMSRLARSCKDWYQLLELCAIFGALIYDLDGLYDPSAYNDRLLLGLKGTMSEAELHILQQRMLQGARQKARRGELISRLPIGYLRDAQGQVAMDPDEGARAAVRRVFELFERIGTVTGTLAQLRAEGVLLGVRAEGGPDRGTLQWRRPNHTTLRNMLAHPMYAGAYAYGRRGQRRQAGRPRPQRPWLPPQDWQVLIRDRFPAYLTWTQYEANLEQMRQNRSLHDRRGSPRRGRALLAGLVVCGRCGWRLLTRYAGKASQPRYCCQAKKIAYAQDACQSLSAKALDGEVVRLALLALEPSALEVSLRVAADLQRQHEQAEASWRQRLERAAYAAERSHRQYQAVEPENRLVARTLEAAWELALRQQRQLIEEHERWRQERPRILTPQEQEQIRALASDLPTLWVAASTRDEDRKAILRLVIERVVVQAEGDSEWVEAWVHWAGGQQTYTRLRRPVARLEQMAAHGAIRERILTMRSQGLASPQIAEALGREGFRTTRGTPFTADGVRTWLARYGPRRGRDGHMPLAAGEWLIPELARHLGVSHGTIRGWVRQGRIEARRSDGPTGRWIVRADDQELAHLMEQRQARRRADTPTSANTTVSGGAT